MGFAMTEGRLGVKPGAGDRHGAMADWLNVLFCFFLYLKFSTVKKPEKKNYWKHASLFKRANALPQK